MDAALHLAEIMKSCKLVQAMLDLDDGIKRIKTLGEERGAESDYYLSSDLLEMAGKGNLTPRHVRENSGTLYGDYTPNAFKGGRPLPLPLTSLPLEVAMGIRYA